MARTKLVPGFRFHPTDIELVKYYLKRKVMRKKLCVDVIADVDIYKHCPWDLPDKSALQIGDLIWYFFCPVEKKYTSGARMNRATKSGYWKATGKDRPVVQNNQVVGMKKTLVFHIGRSPHGERTDWVMHEYRLKDNDLAAKDPYVLCVVYKKNGPGPQNGAQYGAPFNEEDWGDEEENVCAETIPFTPLGAPVSSMLPIAKNDSPTTSALVTVTAEVTNETAVVANETAEVGLSCLSTLSGVEPDPCNMLSSAGANPNLPLHHDDIFSLLDCFTEDTTMVLDGNDNLKETGILPGSEGDEIEPCIDPNDIYNGLGDLEGMCGLGGNVFDFSSGYTVDQVLTGLEKPFLELHDLDSPLPWPPV